MTPLAQALARFLPRPLVLPALALIYAAIILGVLVVGNGSGVAIVYVDVNRD